MNRGHADARRTGTHAFGRAARDTAVSTIGVALSRCGRRARRVWIAVALIATALAFVATSLAQSPASATPAPAPPAAQAPAAAANQSQPKADKNAPEMSSHDAPATFSAKVNLVLVRVVVRDNKGAAIGTLKQEDFQLLDKGKAQVISKFAVEKGSTPGSQTIKAEAAPGEPAETPTHPMAERFVAYLFDDMHLQFGDLARVREAATKHLEGLWPTVRVAIYTTSGQTTQEFTDDRALLRAAMLKIQPRSRTAIENGECPHVSYYMSDAIINRHDDTALAAITQDAISCMSCPQDVDPVRCQTMGQQLASSAAQRTMSLGESENRLSLTVIKDTVRRLAAMPGQRSIVLLSPGFYLIDEHRPSEQDVIDHAIRANVQINAIDARGLYTVIPGGDASERGGSVAAAPIKARYQSEEASRTGDVMAEVAASTGGVFYNNSNDLDAGFQRTSTAPEFYYVLGFTPQNLKFDGAYHALKVSLKNGSGLTLQARKGYFAPRQALDPAMEAKREVEEALFSRDEMQDIPIEVHTQFFKPAPETAKLAIVARVNIRGLHFDKVEDRNHDTLTVVSGVFDQNGNFVNGTEKTIVMRLRDNTLHSLLGTGISTKASFDLSPGSYVVRVVVRDQQGRLMAARNGVVEIP